MRFKHASILTAIALAAALSTPDQVRAQTQWTNAAGGAWSVAANWNPADVPDSGAESAELGLVGPYTVTLNTSPAIGLLTISNPEATLDFEGGRTLSLGLGTHVNDGLMRINSNSSVSDAVLNFSAPAALDGAGELQLIRPGNDSQVTTSEGPGIAVTNTATHTISGTGQISAAVFNEGLISADVSGNALDLFGNDKTNVGIMQATGGGILSIQSITIGQTFNGFLVADGGTVLFPGGTNASVVNGNIESLGAGVVEKGAGGTLTLSDVTADAAFNVHGGGTVAVTSFGLTNNGTISLNTNSSVSDAILRFNNTGTLGGSGEVVLVRQFNDSQVTTAESMTMTNGAAHTISGTGEIHAALINDGLIEANVNASILDLLTNAKTNNATMRATNNSILEIESITVTQDPGALIVADGGTVRFPGGTNAGVINGTLEAINLGTIEKGAGGTVSLTDVSTQGPFNVHGGGVVAVSGAGLTNAGTISLNTNASVSDAFLHFNNTGTLGGAGEVVLVRPGNDSQLTTAVGATITQSAAHRISGTGEIHASLTNDGVISANVNASVLDLMANNKTNNNIIEATNNGTLDIESFTLSQGPAGRVIADGGTVRFPSGTSAGVIAGTLEAINGGVIERHFGGAATLTSVSCQGPFNVHGGGAVAVAGAGLTNDGTISLNTNASVSDAFLHFNNTGTLGGAGEVVLVRPGNDSQITTATDVSMSHGPMHTIRGTGQISAQLINNGIISADSPGNALELFSGDKTNANLMQAIGGGILSIYSVAITQADAAAIVADGGTVRFNGGTDATVSGGAIESVGESVVEKQGGGTATLNNVTSDATFNVHGGGTISVIGGGLTNNGTLSLNTNASVSDALLRFDSTGTLDGSGEVVLVRAGNDSQVRTADGVSFTQAATHTISGTGEIHATLVNDGVIDANVNLSVLDLLANPKTNNNLMTATNNGILDIESTTITQGVSGRIVADGGTVRFPGGTSAGVIAGTLEALNAGVIEKHAGGSAALTDVTSSGPFNVHGGGMISVLGSGLTNDGTISLNTNASVSDAVLRFDATGTLDGAGEVVLVRAGNDSQLNAADGVTMTNGPLHTIRGLGEMNGTFINEGTIVPGLSAGIMVVTGSLSQAASGVMDFEVGGATPGSQHDRIQVNGSVALDGTAVVTITDDFQPSFTNSFDLITTTSGVSGRFSDVVFNGLSLPAALEAQFVYTPNVARLIIDILGDVDNDFDVDLTDFITFSTCFSGGNQPRPDACPPEWFEECDLDNDADVDLVDFITFSSNFTG